MPRIGIKLKIIFVLLICSQAFATTYNHPTISLPLTIVQNDNVNVNSGVLAVTDSSSYTIRINQTGAGVSSLIDIKEGAILSYMGTDSAGYALQVDNSSQCPVTVNVAGTISSGSGARAIHNLSDGTYTQTGTSTGTLRFVSNNNISFNSGAKIYSGNVTTVGNSNTISFNDGTEINTVGSLIIAGGGTGNIATLYSGSYFVGRYGRFTGGATNNTIRINAGSTFIAEIFHDTTGSNTLEINGIQSGIAAFLHTDGNFTVNVGTTSAATWTTGGDVAATTINLDQGSINLGHNLTATTFTVDSGTSVVPTADLTVTTTTFDVNGNLQFGWTNNSTTGTIIAIGSTDLTGSTVTFATPGFIKAGTYTFLTGTLTGTPTITNPTDDIHKTFSSVANSTTITTTVTRIPYDTVVTEPVAFNMAQAFEELGATSTDPSVITLLDSLDATTNVKDLESLLISLSPRVTDPLVARSASSHAINKTVLRLAELRSSYYAGYTEEGNNNFWFRPFFDTSRQKQFNQMVGYRSETTGVSFGYDKEITPNLILGFGGSYSSAVNKADTNSDTRTNIDSYQAMLYGTLSDKNSSYLDWVLATGINRYAGQRRITSGGLDLTASSKYGGQLYTAKAVYSKELVVKEVFQWAPIFSGQLSYMRLDSYTESGAGAANLRVYPKNTLVLQAGAGIKIGLPIAADNQVIVPELRAMVLGDLKGAAQQTTSYFLSGATPIKTTAEPGTIIYNLGGKLTYNMNENFELTANYDFQQRKNFKGHNVYVNFRYNFGKIL